MIGTQTLQFLLKQLFQALHIFDQIVWEFRGNVYLVTNAIFLQNLSQRSLAARIDISGIKIIHPCAVGCHDLPLGFLHVGQAQFSWKTHAAKT